MQNVPQELGLSPVLSVQPTFYRNKDEQGGQLRELFLLNSHPFPLIILLVRVPCFLFVGNDTRSVAFLNVTDWIFGSESRFSSQQHFVSLSEIECDFAIHGGVAHGRIRKWNTLVHFWCNLSTVNVNFIISHKIYHLNELYTFLPVFNEQYSKGLFILIKEVTSSKTHLSCLVSYVTQRLQRRQVSKICAKHQCL